MGASEAAGADALVGTDQWGDDRRPDVDAALQRVLASAAFVHAPRSQAFLAHVVTEALAGRADSLSERTVGRRALGLPDGFTGQDDSQVRVRATRVRKALARYYDTEGNRDPLRIVLPPGTYVPSVEANAEEQARWPAADLPSVLVLVPHTSPAAARDLAARLADALVHRLGTFSEFHVIGPATAGATAGAGRGNVHSRQYVLSGVVAVEKGSVRLSAQLTERDSGEVLWSDVETHDEADVGVGVAARDGAFALTDAWASRVAGTVGDYSGVVARHEVGRPRTPNDSPEYSAMLAYYANMQASTPARLTDAVAATDRALALGRSPVVLAMRAGLHNDQAFSGFGDYEEHLGAADALAREALTLKPEHAQAHLVLGTTARLRQQWDLAAWHAEHVIELTPWHPLNLMTAGILIACAGDWLRGIAVLREGQRLHTRYPTSVHAVHAMAYLLSGDDAAALAEASLIDEPTQVYGAMYRAMALCGLGDLGQAQREMDRVLAVEPRFLDDAESYFRRNMRATDEQIELLMQHLEALRNRPVVG